MEEENTVEAMNEEVHDIISLLSSPERDFLLRNNGDLVTMSSSHSGFCPYLHWRCPQGLPPFYFSLSLYLFFTPAGVPLFLSNV